MGVGASSTQWRWVVWAAQQLTNHTSSPGSRGAPSRASEVSLEPLTEAEDKAREEQVFDMLSAGTKPHMLQPGCHSGV